MDWHDAGWRFYEQTLPDGDDRLSAVPIEWQRELAALAILDQQMNNGAYLQFLANFGRTAYVLSHQALQKIGAYRMVEIIESCQTMIDEHFPTDGRPLRELGQLMINEVIGREGNTVKEAGSVLPEEVIARIYELSYEYMSYPDPVWNLAQSHYGQRIEAWAARFFPTKPWWRFWS